MKKLSALAFVLVAACGGENASGPSATAPSSADPAPAPATTPAAPASATPAPPASATPAPAASSGIEETEVPADAPKEAKQALADGRPKAFKAGAAESFWIWQDAKGTHWHLRTTAKDKAHRFHGVAVGDADLQNVASARTEAGDRFKLKGGKRASFDFSTDSASDGLDFDVSNNSCVRFVLFIDGKPADTDRIKLGKDSKHPQGNNFKLCP